MFLDMLTLVVVAGLSLAIKMTGKWYITEAERQEEEKERTEARTKKPETTTQSAFFVQYAQQHLCADSH